MDAVVDVVVRTTIVYLVIISGIRLFGKRDLSQLSIFDLVFILLISNAVQNAMVGDDSTVAGGIVAALTLFILNYLFRTVTRSPLVEKVLEGEPLMIVYNGQVIKGRLQKAGITENELMQALREHGLEEVKDVKMAVQEVDGGISVISKDATKRHPTRRRRAHKALSGVS